MWRVVRFPARGHVPLRATLCYDVHKVANVCPEIKKTLLGQGRWADFVIARERAKADGCSNCDSLHAAIAEICPELQEAQDLYEEGLAERRRPRRQKSGPPAPEPGPPPPKAPVVPPVDMSVFEGRRCSYSAAIEWAYVAAQFGCADPSSAPSAKAYALLVDFVKDPGYRKELFKGVAQRMASRDSDDEAGKSFDGQEEYDLLRSMGVEG